MLKFEPIGTVKQTKAQYWRGKVYVLRRAVYVAFVLGTVLGVLIGICI